MNRRAQAKMGLLNPSWKGDAVGYGSLHEWVRNRYEKPVRCERCQTSPPNDLANKSGEYQRDLADWWYLCRKCHMEIDGRSEQLRQSGRSRKFPDKICEGCATLFHPDRKITRFCSAACLFKWRVGRPKKEWGLR